MRYIAVCMEKGLNMRARFKLGAKLYAALALSFIFVLLVLTRTLDIPKADAVCIAMALVFSGSLEVKIHSPIISAILLPTLAGSVSLALGQTLAEADFSGMNKTTLICNLVLISLLYYVLLLVFSRFKIAVVLSLVAFFILHFVNYVLILFRGRELSLTDFYSIKSAANISQSYTLTLNLNAIYCIAFVVILVFSTLTTIFPDREKTDRKKIRLASLGCTALFSLVLFFGINASTNCIHTWGKSGTVYNGATYNLVVEYRKSRVTKPEGYSVLRAEEILQRYTRKKEDSDTPHVIVIMNEAFSDLSVLGDFNTNTEPIPFFSSLSQNCVKGYALSSVLGGNTATSEWEFLTGNTAAFLPYGSIAYQQYVKGYAGSIVKTLKNDGYTCVAMHPYISTFWKRDTVYPLMGFDETYFMESLTTTDKLRGFVTDRAFFTDIIERFEAREKGVKLFMFNVTMQNHGGYKWGGFQTEVETGNDDWDEVDQYLTLTNITDSAFKELLDYFTSVDEKVMIVMFGDHQPSLPQSFYSSVFGEEQTFDEVQKKQTVPFIMWTNYESPEENIPLIGLNSLSALMLERAGIILPEYQAFLLDMRRDLPALNAYGYLSSNGLHTRTRDAESSEKTWLEEYRIVQYYNLFDNKNRKEALLYETE